MTNVKKIWKQLPGWNESRGVRIAWIFLFIVGFIAFTGPFIANEKPYMCRLEGKTYFPLFSGTSASTLSAMHPSSSPVDWLTTDFESIWRTPIPYSHHTIDLKSGSNLSPFDRSASIRFRHWLGTDPLGRDVMAGMIRGCRVSLLIGLGSMLLALMIGVPLGSAAAYWGNQQWRASFLRVMLILVFFAMLLYFLWMPFSMTMKLLFIALLIGVFVGLWYISGKMHLKQISVPVDQFVMGLASIIDSFPGLFIILILLFIIPVKGWMIVLLAIALLRWPSMARYMRAEVYKMKESNYIKAAQVLNLNDLYIMRKHIIPYAFRPVMISFIFGVSSAILAESSLSFLGIGLPAEEVNWGRLLSQARNHFDSWWLVFFPGAAIFMTLLSLYTIGNALQKKVMTS
ncbi:MAG: ABC transporter permease [Saprospiraceae bacterium]